MYRAFEVLLEGALDAAIHSGDLILAERPPCRLEAPDDPVHGDATSRIALAIARRTGRPADAVAHTLVRHLHDADGWVEHLEAAGPGFVNVRASLAFWRGALAACLWGPSSPSPRLGRAIVAVSAPIDRGIAIRAEALADGLARLLASVGYEVEHAAAGALAECGAAGEVERVVVIHTALEPGAVRRAKETFASAGGRAGRVTAIPVGPLVVRRRGHALPPSELGVALASPAARFCLAATPGAAQVLDVERLSPDRIDNPWTGVRYALVRVARLGAAGSVAPTPLHPLGEPERACLRAVGTFDDERDVAARRLDPGALVAYAGRLAAVFHRYYNRGAFEDRDPHVASARRALACGIGRVLEAALEVVGAVPERG